VERSSNQNQKIKSDAGEGNYHSTFRPHPSPHRDPQEVIESCDEAIKANPEDDDAYFWRGLAYNEQSNYKKAADDLTNSIKLRSGNTAVALVYRAGTYSALGQHQKALDDYNMAISLAPTYLTIYMERGQEYHRLRQYRKAIQDYNKEISLNPHKETDWETYGLRGDAY